MKKNINKLENNLGFKIINLDEKMDEDSNENEFRIDLEHESGSVGKSDVKKGFSITINL